jgi:PAS domain S-box-containing protein
VGPEAGADGQLSTQKLHPIAITASDEIGALARAFNGMIAELRQTLETLELRVQTRTAELRQQARYLRTLIDTLPLLAWFKDTQCRFLAANQTMARACGRTPEEMVGKSDLDVWPRELAEAYRADDVEVMASRQRKTREEPVADLDGTRWMETDKAPVVDEDGTVLGTVGVARDISARKATEAAREAALAEAERLARVRSEFLAQMSHELRTPLNGILGYAQILRRDKIMGERQLMGLSIIQQSGEHLLTLINDILDFAKVEAGKLELLPTDISLAQFLRVIASIINVKAEQKDLLFTVETAPDLPEGIRADEKRLRQVLLNLLANAVKFTERGQVTLRVRTVSPTRLRFEVQDTGSGIGPDQLKLLFQPFEQASDSQHRAGGTGLGLAISRQLVRLMGDDIRVESRLGQGSTFWFELEAPVVIPTAVAPSSEGLINGYVGPRKRVLVVDDLVENRAVAVAMLSQLGFEMFEAADGREGLEKAQALHPDLILMDIVMPGMSGQETTRRLRQMSDFKEVPIIAISASASDHDAKECLEAGANAFLPKPIVMNRLLDEIGPLLKLIWTYEVPKADASVEPVDTAPLVAPPAEEMEVLYHLARRGRMHDILEWTDHAVGLDARHQSFINRLRVLAKGYQSKAILNFVEQHMNRAP